MNKILLFTVFALVTFTSFAQPENRWQQRVSYKMQIDMDAAKNQFKGKQRLEYSNNSDKNLDKVFYHLYFNAFQPNSSMDTRSRELGKIVNGGRQDWDPRVKDRILNLKEDEIGYQKIISLKMNGVLQPFKYHETILEVNLTKAISPKTKVVFEMEFEAQVPLQVRRSGRDNPTTGVRLSMSQWYPKMCEYDYEGWHATPYIAREFYGVWGDFDITINIDKEYKLGGTGVLVNANEIGWGYDKEGTALKSIATAKRSWHFVGKNIHDFVWAADPEYLHFSRSNRNGLMNHVIVKENAIGMEKWKGLLDLFQNALPYIEKTFGEYPYPQYSFIQGGDGGMEYPMATLLADVPGAMHELMHSWYQGMLATNEGMYPWMDEGMTEYAGVRVYAALGNKKELQQDASYQGYFSVAKSNLEEPLTTHADHYNTNFAYSRASYYKGAVFIEQLGYIIGAQTRDKVLLEYYKRWRFKHPNPSDFIAVAEDVSGIKLDWYKEYWCGTTKKIDYGIDSLWEENGMSKIRIRRIGQMPMPIDVKLTKKDGSVETHTIPLNLMFGNKKQDDDVKLIVENEWRWTHPTYVLEFKTSLRDLKKVEIDATQRMADVDRRNNMIEINF
jgi:Peptidase family M1 domain